MICFEGSIDRNKNYSISVPDAREGIVPDTRVPAIETGKIMLIALAYRSSFVVNLRVLVLEVEVPLLLADVTHNRTLPILVVHEALLGRSEYVGVMMNH